VSVGCSLFEPLKEFGRRLPDKFYCGDSKRFGSIMPKEKAKDYPYIQINYPAVYYLCFDVDSHDAAIRPLEVDLPFPTLAAISPDSGHGHLMYQLLDPIPRMNLSKDLRGLLSDVVLGYKVMLDSDKCITTQRQLVKNPLCDEWRVLEGCRPFLLSDMIESVPAAVKREIENKKGMKSEIPTKSYGMQPFENTLQTPDLPHSRNCSVFENARHYAYSIVGGCNSYDSFCGAVFEYVEKLNDREVPKFFASRGKLEQSELRYIAKSIAGWTWDHRNYFTTNRGAMELPPIKETDFQSEDDKERELERRRELSAEWTNTARKESTQGKIKRALELCLKHGFEPTAENISTFARVSRMTVYRYKKMLPEPDFRPVNRRQEKH